MNLHLRYLALLSTVSIVISSAAVLAQEFTFTDDFSSGKIEDYNFVDNIGFLLGADFAELIPTDGAIRVTAPTTPDVMLGPARSGFEFIGQPNRFSDFDISVDVVAWDNSLVSGFGPTARTREVGGPGTIDMYGLAILTNTTAPDSTEISDFFIMNRFDNEVPTALDAEPIELDASKQYRIRFAGVGPNFVGELFDLSDLTTPLVTLSAMDETYSSGGSGLALGAAGLEPTGWILPDARADATFDNYSITATVPEPQRIHLCLFVVLAASRIRRRRKEMIRPTSCWAASFS